MSSKKVYHQVIRGVCLNCGDPATRVLNVRMRRPDTGASFGPNIDPAVFCADCGDGGMEVEIRVRPNTSGLVHFTVAANGREVVYLHPMRGNPGQKGLWG